MANLVQILRQLQGERKHTQEELGHLDEAIAVFEKLVGNNPGPGRPRKARRRLSAAARRKISRAQKTRWAKVRQQAASKG